jgi:drug/metabolite transporter (DMT)-like permease
MTVRDFGLLVILSAMWGASYLFLRVAAPVLGVFVLIDLRVLIAGGVLLIYALLLGRRLQIGGRWRSLLLLGAVNAALPFTFIAAATVYLNASIASILNATTPLFTALVAALWMKEALGYKKLLGLGLGLLGVVVLMGWSPLGLSSGVVLGVFLSLAGSLCYGIGGVYTKVALRGLPTLDLAIGQQLAAGLWLLPLALATAELKPVSTTVVAAVITLAIVCTAVAYLIYFDLIARVGPTNTLSVTFLVPVFGTLWGVVLLHEPLRASLLLGLVIILTGVFLVTGVKLRSDGLAAANASR